MRRPWVSILLFVALVTLYGAVTSYYASGDAGTHLSAGVGRLVIYATLFFGNIAALSGLLVFHYRNTRKTGRLTTTVFAVLSIYRELAALLLALGLALIVLDRFFPSIPDIPDFLIYFLISVSAITVFLRGLAFMIEVRRRGFLEQQIYLWPWSKFLESLKEARRAKRGEEKED